MNGGRTTVITTGDGTYDTDKHTGFDATDGTLYLYFKPATTIEAGRPYIVKWASGADLDSPTFTGVTVSTAAPTGVTLTDGKYIVSAQNTGLNTVQFIGSYSPVAITPNDKSNLFLGTSTDAQNETQSTLFYPNAANNDDGNYYVNALRAYFHVALTGAANVRAFVLNFGDEETAIKEIYDLPIYDLRFDGSAWYTLDGRRLNGKPTKAGIYVNNGRKVAIK